MRNTPSSQETIPKNLIPSMIMNRRNWVFQETKSINQFVSFPSCSWKTGLWPACSLVTTGPHHPLHLYTSHCKTRAQKSANTVKVVDLFHPAQRTLVRVFSIIYRCLLSFFIPSPPTLHQPLQDQSSEKCQALEGVKVVSEYIVIQLVEPKMP